MHFFKSIRTNKFSFLSFNVINISLSLLIFGIIFFYCSQITPLISLSKSLDSKNVYVVKGVEQVGNYYSTEENNLRSEYYFDYVEIDDKPREILYLNKEAYYKGLPVLIDDTFVYLFKFNKVTLEKNILYTNNVNNISSTIKYENYFDKYTLNNLFIALEVDCPYICLVDDIESPNYAIYNTASEKLKNSSIFNDISDETIVGEGSYLSSNTSSARELQMKLFVIVSLIPLIFVSMVLVQFYRYFIMQRKDDILINYIYYKKKNELLKSICVPIFLVAAVGSTISILITFLIFMRNFYSLLLIALVINLLLSIITIYVTTRTEISKISNQDAWREYDD